MIKRYTTKSGSVYEVDTITNRVRKVQGGSGTARITEEWKPVEDVTVRGGCLCVFWGIGRDEVSEALGTPHEDVPSRWTVTSPIVREETV